MPATRQSSKVDVQFVSLSGFDILVYMLMTSIELGRDAGVGFSSLRDPVGEGSGKVGGERREREGEAAAAEVDVYAAVGGYEIQVGVPCVVVR